LECPTATLPGRSRPPHCRRQANTRVQRRGRPLVAATVSPKPTPLVSATMLIENEGHVRTRR
jgi:hypothetical protein